PDAPAEMAEVVAHRQRRGGENPRTALHLDARGKRIADVERRPMRGQRALCALEPAQACAVRRENPFEPGRTGETALAATREARGRVFDAGEKLGDALELALPLRERSAEAVARAAGPSIAEPACRAAEAGAIIADAALR